MAVFERPGPWRWEVQAVVKDGRVTTDFQRWLNSTWANTNFIGTGKQDADDDLTAISVLSGTGIAVRTAADTWALRTLTAPSAGFTITNPAGVAGNPTFVLANDLAALEALSGTDNIYYRSGADTWTSVTIGAGLTFAAGTLDTTGGGGGGGSGVSIGLVEMLSIGQVSP